MREMTANDAIAIGLCVIVLVALGLPMANDLGVMPWADWLMKYQSLIAGVLALVAAWVTVRQMRTSDDKSDLRHETLLRATNAIDRLKSERALNPALYEMGKSIIVVDDFCKAASGHRTRNGMKTCVVEKGPAMRAATRMVQTALSRDQFRSGSVLFDGFLSASCEDGLRAAAGLEELYNEYWSYDDSIEGEYLAGEDWFDENYTQFEKRAVELYRVLMMLVTGLERHAAVMGASYTRYRPQADLNIPED